MIREINECACGGTSGFTGRNVMKTYCKKQRKIVTGYKFFSYICTNLNGKSQCRGGGTD